MLKQIVIDHCTVTADCDMSDEEMRAYYDYMCLRYPHPDRVELTLDADTDYVNAKCMHFKPFERIRRITGYLVGTIDRWNNGKRAEEADRVKHKVEW